MSFYDYLIKLQRIFKKGRSKMKYIIKGGEFNNKGAEAMSLVAIYNIISRDSKAIIYFYDYGYKTDLIEQLAVVPFKIDLNYLKFLAGGGNWKYYGSRMKNFLKYFLKRKNYISVSDYDNVKDIIMSADYFIDISGYSLSTVWGKNEIDFYLSWIKAIYMNNNNCKIILLPQSFGPFDETVDKNIIKNVLSKCNKIYARETSGIDILHSLELKNISFCYDSVLIEKKYKPEYVLKNYDKYICDDIGIYDNAIGIVPNARLFDVGGFDTAVLFNMYVSIISILISRYQVLLIPHAGEDMAICKKLKSLFNSNENVIFIDKVLNSFIFEKLAGKMRFIVASRYHSIVHAYRQGTPAIIIGWSDKYNEIALACSQVSYIYDPNSEKSIEKVLDVMIRNCTEMRTAILTRVKQLQESYDCYHFLDEDIQGI